MNSMSKFSFDTIKDFDKHIKDSIPNYDLLSEGIVSLSKFFLDKTAVYFDVGCSTGRMLELIPHDGLKIGLDNSKNLLPESHDAVVYKNVDLNEGYEFKNACLITSIFTLQFLRFDSRRKLIQQIYDGLNEGGGLIVAEKVFSNDSQLQEMLNFSLYDYKDKAFSSQEILDKEKSLRKILKPNTSAENQRIFEEVGFKRLGIFWKFYNFECWIYIK